MRVFMLATSFVACAFLAAVSAQTAQTPAPAARARPALTIEVTDAKGATIPDVVVRLTGTLAREGSTDGSGQLRFAGMRAGNYRLRFEHEAFTTLERDVTVATRTVAVDVTLTPAPPPKVVQAPPPPPPPAPVAGPPGTQRTTNVPVFVERNFISNKEGIKESLLGCTGEATSTLLQLREPLAEHAHDTAEMLYIVAGDATHHVDGRDETLTAGSFSAVPRGMLHSLTRRGRNPVIIISTIAGKACADQSGTQARTQ
jgi:mannose-6-phosphate isomerase-like protein (cupin superfamily)